MAGLFSDVPFAWRQLRKSPAFALTAILTLGLGIGVNAAMFSVIDQVLLRPLPYGNQNRLAAIGSAQEQGGLGPISMPDYTDYAARSHSLEKIGFYSMQLPTLGGTENPEVVPQIMSSANLFEVLGVRPALGRSFIPADAKAGRANVMILGDSAWKKFFHGDPGIVGRSVPINGDAFTVIGVMPPEFGFPQGVGDEIFSPVNVEDKSLQERDSAALQQVGLLRPGVTTAQVQVELNSIHKQLLHDYPKDESVSQIRAVGYRDSITESTRPALFALDWAVVAVWLIACANVAGLMLTRTNARRREIAIRGALGAQRGRIARQFLTESLLLSLAGGAAGLGMAVLALRLLKKYLENSVLNGSYIHVNAAVFVFLLLASCISALVFGLVPAWHAANTPAQEGLRDSTAAAGTSKKQAFWRDSLVVAEITLTLALLVAAGLMMRTLVILRHTEMGFTTEHVVTGSMFLPTHGGWWSALGIHKDSPNLVQIFYRPLVDKLVHTPGVEAAGLSTIRPLTPGWNFVDTIEVNGRPKPAHGSDQNAQVRAATGDYFRAMGIRLVAGRFFGDADGADAPVAAVINQSMVKRIFPKENPLGKQIRISDTNGRQWATVVGVAEDARQRYVGEAALPELLLNLDQLRPGDDMYSILATFHMDVIVRSRLPAATIENAIRKEVHDLRPEIAVQNLQSMQEVVDDSLNGQTLAARLLGIFGVAALAIAVAGIYGLLAYSVSQRTRELGLRIALGAQRGDVLWMVLRHALILLGIGVAAGLAVAWATSGVMSSFIYGVHGYDVVTVLLVALVLGVCGMGASYLPARRAANVDPMEALRSE
jgi:predicted permease